MKELAADKNRHITNMTRVIIGTALILMVPLVAMMFTDEVNWGLGDFVIIGALLIGTGVLYEIFTSFLKEEHRPVVAVVLFAMVVLIWAELAVGIFGSPFAGN